MTTAGDAGHTGPMPNDQATAPVRIRSARVQDAAALARVHVGAWQATYRGTMPDAYLDGLDVEHWTHGWARELRAGRRANLMVAEVAGDLVGFAHPGPDRAEDGDGELYAINVAPDAWGRGVGRSLLEASEDALWRLGHRCAVLWVVPSNDRARRFYERAGWQDDHAAKRAVVNGVEVDEVRYAKVLSPR